MTSLYRAFFASVSSFLTLAQVQGPDRDALGLSLLDLLPLETALEGANSLLGAITESLGPIALCAKP
jgi:hypothetical protein